MHTYIPVRKICASVAFLMSFTLMSSADAETGGKPLLALQVNDVTPATGFSSNAANDVLGVRIGMTHAEVETTLSGLGMPMLVDAQKIPDADKFDPQRIGFAFRSADVTPTFTWKDGYEVRFEPVRASAGMTMYSEQADAMGKLAEYLNGQYLWVSYGGPSVGGRVQEIRRSQQLDEPVDTQAMISGISDKYGSPSKIKEWGGSWIDLSYYYKGGKLMAQNDRSVMNFSLYCKPPGSSGGSSEVLYHDANIAAWYSDWRDPRESRDFCDATVFVRLYFGDLPNTIDALDVAVIDNVARFENSNSIGAQAEAAHAEWLKSVAGSTKAPDL